MKLVVFGASGGVGKEVVRQALAAGHQVLAVSRSVSSEFDPLPNLRLLQGDITDASFVAAVLKDCDVVISAIGTTQYKQPVSLYSSAVKTILPLMATHGPKRLIVLSAGGATTETNDPLVFTRIIKPILQRVFHHLYADMLRMERLIEATDLDWTILRLAYLRDKPLRGAYRTSYNSAVRYGQSINRADVAHYIVHHLHDPTSYKQHVSIAY